MHRPSTRSGESLRLMVGVVALAGVMCASAGAAAAGPALYGVVSGSRLQARFYDGGAGAIVFAGWFDSQLGIQCVFQRSGDGQMRCLPGGQPAVWMDATCTMPVWSAECRESVPRYVTAWVSQSVAAYELGEPYTGTVHATGNTTGGWQRSCLDVSGKGGSFYSMGAEIPSESLVAATIRSAPIDGGKLFVSTVQSDDGSTQVAVEVNPRFARTPQLSAFPAGTFSFLGSGRLRAPSYVAEDGPILVDSADGFIDSQSDEPCRPVRFADGLRCVPWRVASLNNKVGPYVDAGCTTLLSESRPGSRLGPTTTGDPAVAMSSCSAATAYTLGDVVTPGVVYFKGAACEPRTPRASIVYRQAIPAPDSLWAPVAERME